MGPKYIYQLLDDTNHDSFMTFEITESIVCCDPEINEKDGLILRSGIYPEQYKCKYIFLKMKAMTSKFGIDAI